MELPSALSGSGPKKFSLKKFLIFFPKKSAKRKFLLFSQKNPNFQETETPPKIPIFHETELSYIQETELSYI